MKITIDGSGRLVLPKTIRETAGLYAGAQLDVVIRDGDVIELHPTPREVRIEQRGRLFVAVPVEPGPMLPEDVVQTTLDDVRRERARKRAEKGL